MPHQIGWRLENHVIQITLSGRITTATLHQALLEALPLLYPIDNTLHAMVMFETGSKMDITLSEATDSSIASAFFMHPQLGWTVYVGDTKNALFQFITSVQAQQYNARTKWFDRPEEALAFLTEVDMSLLE